MSGVRSFLSTPSMRRATGGPQRPRGNSRISIHALREEGDPAPYPLKILNTQFLSTPSARRATKDALDKLEKHLFLSTPSARRATESLRPGRRPCNFYPRPPRGGRHHPPGSGHPRKNFYPRPPRGGRLPCAGHQIAETRISINALREEGDIRQPPQMSQSEDFYPRPPRGGRLRSI